MAIDRERVESIFNAAAGMGSAAERAGYLDVACGDDGNLRQRVEGLLASHDADDSFLARPLDPAAAVHPALAVAEGAGARIGRYKLLQLIGEGGFGSVFMAEQERPVRRKVALKIIKLGMDTKQVIARFEAERQALAIMDHPNIAKVLDAGATDTGRPYFVMELVKGVPVTEYCDANNLTTRQRLELFLPVCHAVQHAHQKGIIHRDIKPSNILVTMADGSPVPKVIDFGIAKATSARLTEMTLFTEFRQLVGTPEYMSPEQAEMSGIDVDTRTDVYSLGVLLYELLTGTTPFDAKELRSKAYGEIQRMIREVEPPRPSTRLSSLGPTLATVAAHRRIEPRKLGQLMRGELDWIVMKAMEKDRTRRYETANSLALDVRQYLDNEPVSARPATATYRLRKFAAKHKVGFAAAAAVAAVLILGIIGTSAGLVRARRQADRATVVSEFLQSVLSSARPDVLGGGESARVVDLLQLAEAKIEKELADQPDAQVQTYYTIFFTYCSLDLMPEGRVTLDRAHALAKQHGMEETDIGVRIACHKARLDFENQLPAEPCERLARDAAGRAQRLFGEDHHVTVFARGVLARTCAATGKDHEAADNYRRFEAGVRRLGQVSLPEPAVGAALVDHAFDLQSHGEFAAAEANYRDALGIATASRFRISRLEAAAWKGLAEVLGSQEKWSEMADVYDRALADLRPGVSGEHWDEMMQGDVQVLRRLGRESEAERVQQRLRAHWETAASAPAATPTALIRRAMMRIQLRRFKDADADLAHVMELDPKQNWAWFHRGCLLAYLGDEPAYRAHCDAMVKQFDTDDPQHLERTAKTSLLLAGTPHLPRLSAMVDRALAVHAGETRAWDQLAKAMAEYRAGRFQDCVRAASEAAAGLRKAETAGARAAELFATMAHYRLGWHEKAGPMLDEVARYVEQEVQKFGDGGVGPAAEYDMVDWLILHVALREAKALIRGELPATRRSEG